MPCSNDPLIKTVSYTTKTIFELVCTPNGNAKLVFFPSTLNGVNVTFKCLDTVPTAPTGVRAVLTPIYEIQPHGQALPRMVNLALPYDATQVVDPTKLRCYRYIVDPVGWYPVPSTHQYVFDAEGVRLLYVKVAENVVDSGQYMLVELN